jgi:hypothetical protein
MNPKASLFNFTPTPTHPSSLCIRNNLLRTHDHGSQIGEL